MEFAIYIILMLSALVIALIVAARYPYRRPRPERRPTSLARLLVIAFITSTILYTIFVAAMVLGLLGYDEPWSIQDIFLLYGAFLVVFLFVAMLICIVDRLGSFVNRMKNRTSRTFRGVMAFGIACWLIGPGFMIVFIADGIERIFIFCLFGVLLGLLAGPFYVWQMKKNMVGDKILFPGSPLQRLGFRGVIAFIAAAGIMLLLIRGEYLPPDVWISTFFGVILGMVLYALIWTLIYEKRNNIRLTLEYTDSEYPAELGKY